MKHTLMKVYRGEGCPIWQLEEPRLDENMQVGGVLQIDTGGHYLVMTRKEGTSLKT